VAYLFLGFVRFKPDTYARLGPIITFHTYAGQNDKRHAHYDYEDLSPKRTPRDPSTFNYIIGAYDAIEKSTKLVNHYVAKTKWEGEGGVREFFDTEVFILDRDVKPSNTDVDERFGLPETSGSPTVTDANSTGSKQYQEGLAVKVALLESGLAYVEDGSSKRDGLSLSRTLHQPWSLVLAVVGWFILLAGLLLAFVVARLLTRLLKLL